MAAILVVEDRPEFRTLLQAAVTRAGHESIMAKDATEARVHLLKGPAMMFVDLCLPSVGSGVEFIRFARRLAANIPVVVVSGLPDGPRQLEEAGITDAEFVHKPFSFQHIAELIEKHLGADA